MDSTKKRISLGVPTENEITHSRKLYLPCQKHAMPKGEFLVSETDGQFRVVVLEPMRFIDHQDLPFDRGQLNRIVRDHHFRGRDDHVNHPGTVGLGRVLFQALFQIQLVESNGCLRTIALVHEFVFANELSVIGRAVVNNGIQIRPPTEFTMPVSQSRERGHDKDGASAV